MQFRTVAKIDIVSILQNVFHFFTFLVERVQEKAPKSVAQGKRSREV